MEQFDKETDDVFDSEEYRYYALNDDEEDFSESLFHSYEMGSSSLDTDDIFDTSAQYQFRTAAYQEPYNSTFSPLTKEKEDMEIEDVVKDKVLPFLPAKSLMRFRSVSKEWEHRIRSPFLAHQQSYFFKDISGFFRQRGDTNPTFVTLNRAAYGVPIPSLRFLPDLVNIRTSSNGLLVCQGHTGNNSYYICNPATKAWKELPKPEYYHGYESALVLAFEPYELNVEAHYQLICAVPLLGQQIVCFEIYSSETRSWRCSATDCPELGEPSFRGNGLYMKGVAYWETSTREVLAFDPKNEIYGIISRPSESPGGGILAEIHEELCYITISDYMGNEYSINIYGGMELSLRKTIAVRLEGVPKGARGCRILTLVNGDAVMILVGSFIYSYSLSDQRIEVISQEAGVDSLSTTRFLPYVNSLVTVA